MKRVVVVLLGMLLPVFSMAVGCKGGSAVSPQPNSSLNVLSAAPAAAVAIFGQEFSLGNYQLRVDPKTLEYSVVPLAGSRSANWSRANNQGNIVDLDLGTYLNVLPAGAELFGLHKVQFVEGNLRIFFKHSHPWPRPNLDLPGHARTNRADLGYTGRLVILADTTEERLDEQSFFGGDVIANTDAILDPDGYIQPITRALIDDEEKLSLIGTSALAGTLPELTNTFPYVLLADEMRDSEGLRLTGQSTEGNRHDTVNFGVLSNTLGPMGNYDPEGEGWRRSQLADGNWTGYDYIHAGQTVVNSFTVASAWLNDPANSELLVLNVSLLVKWTDPKLSNLVRLPPDSDFETYQPFLPPNEDQLPGNDEGTVDPFIFAYRLPHGALDVSVIQVLPVAAIEASEGSESELVFSVRDWDASADPSVTDPDEKWINTTGSGPGSTPGFDEYGTYLNGQYPGLFESVDIDMDDSDPETDDPYAKQRENSKPLNHVPYRTSGGVVPGTGGSVSMPTFNAAGRPNCRVSVPSLGIEAESITLPPAGAGDPADPLTYSHRLTFGTPTIVLGSHFGMLEIADQELTVLDAYLSTGSGLGEEEFTDRHFGLEPGTGEGGPDEQAKPEWAPQLITYQSFPIDVIADCAVDPEPSEEVSAVVEAVEFNLSGPASGEEFSAGDQLEIIVNLAPGSAPVFSAAWAIKSDLVSEPFGSIDYSATPQTGSFVVIPVLELGIAPDDVEILGEISLNSLFCPAEPIVVQFSFTLHAGEDPLESDDWVFNKLRTGMTADRATGRHTSIAWLPDDLGFEGLDDLIVVAYFDAQAECDPLGLGCEPGGDDRNGLNISGIGGGFSGTTDASYRLRPFGAGVPVTATQIWASTDPDEGIVVIFRDGNPGDLRGYIMPYEEPSAPPREFEPIGELSVQVGGSPPPIEIPPAATHPGVLDFQDVIGTIGLTAVAGGSSPDTYVLISYQEGTRNLHVMGLKPDWSDPIATLIPNSYSDNVTADGFRQIIDGDSDVGDFSSITVVNVDGVERPVIAYHDAAQSRLLLARTTAGVSGWNPPSTLPAWETEEVAQSVNGEPVGKDTTVVRLINNAPAVAYRVGIGQSSTLWYVPWLQPSSGTGAWGSAYQIDPGMDDPTSPMSAGFEASMAVVNNHPVVVYRRVSATGGNQVWVARSFSEDPRTALAWQRFMVEDTGPVGVGQYCDITVRTASSVDAPIISYWSLNDFDDEDAPQGVRIARPSDIWVP